MMRTLVRLALVDRLVLRLPVDRPRLLTSLLRPTDLLLLAGMFRLFVLELTKLALSCLSEKVTRGLKNFSSPRPAAK